MSKFFLVFLLMTTQLWAQIETEQTVSESIKTIKAQEAKIYLVHRAVLQALKQYSTELGINSEEFEKKLNSKFDSYFIGFKNRRLSEKFGKSYAANLTPEQKETFLAGIEANRAEELVKFAKLDRLLDSYAFKSIDHDPKDITLWKGSVVLNLNRTKFTRYHERLTSDESKQYSRIQLITEITPFGFSWPDLGLEKSTSFTDPLLDSWMKWLEANQPNNVGEISQCKDSCLDDFNQWQQIPQEEGMAVPEHLLNSLWLKVSFHLKKVAFRSTINEWEFEWEGSVVLLDVNTKKILYSYTMKTEKRTWRMAEQKELNTALVSSMYRSPLEALTTVVRKVQDAPRLNHLSRLLIQGHAHLGDVLSLIDLLKKKGSSMNLEILVDVFSRNEAQLLCFYQGEEKSFTDLLSGVKELKSSHNYSLVNEFTGVHQMLKMVAE